MEIQNKYEVDTSFIGSGDPLSIRSEQVKKKSTARKDICPNAKNCEMRMPIGNQAWTTYGGLGPDLSREDIAQRSFVTQKVRKYSEKLRLKNRSMISAGVTLNEHPESPTTPSKRAIALEFAKSIRKPYYRRHQHQQITSNYRLTESEVLDNSLSLLLSRFDELTPVIEAIRAKYHDLS